MTGEEQRRRGDGHRRRADQSRTGEEKNERRRTEGEDERTSLAGLYKALMYKSQHDTINSTINKIRKQKTPDHKPHKK